MTLADWQAMGVTEVGYDECVAGYLSHTPTPCGRHQKARGKLCWALDEHLPHELVAVPSIDVVLEPEALTVRAPDVVVIPMAHLEQEPTVSVSVAEVSLVVELVETHTRHTDRVTKLSEYAEAGIEEYWIVDGDPLSLSVHVLESGAYRLVGEFTGVADLTACGVPVQLDLDALARR